MKYSPFTLVKLFEQVFGRTTLEDPNISLYLEVEAYTHLSIKEVVCWDIVLRIIIEYSSFKGFCPLVIT
jgi:hypothetical protein